MKIENQVLNWAEALEEGSYAYLQAGNALNLNLTDLVSLANAILAAAPAPSAPIGYVVDSDASESVINCSLPVGMGVYAAPAPSAPSDAQDAARYRWLRVNNIVANVRFHFANGESPYVYAEELDMAIDYNMNKP